MLDDVKTEAAEALKLATTRFDLALAGSNTRVWNFTFVDEKTDRARAYSINCWTPLGYPEQITTS